MKNKKELAIYVHIPFCMEKCFYCDFLSGPFPKQTQERYLKAVLNEIRSYKFYAKEYQVKTIFIGGGTPSSINAIGIERIMQELSQVFEFDVDKDLMEITIEINPGSVTEEKLKQYYACGINRISFGLQSTNNEELKRLGRIHTYERFLENYHAARSIGFDNINVDLISSIPGQSKESYYETLERVIALRPEHISAYSLIIEEGTPYFKLYGEETEEETQTQQVNLTRLKEACERNVGYELPSEEEDRTMYEMTKKIMHEHGYERYEISNYARSGYECKHNKAYWTRKDYLGIGLGSASLMENTRFTNVTDMEEYIRIASNKEVKLEELHTDVTMLNKQDQMEEFMFLGLRLMRGVNTNIFEQEFNQPIQVVYGNVLEKLIEEELLTWDGCFVKLTDRGIDISNYVFSEFLLEDNENKN